MKILVTGTDGFIGNAVASQPAFCSFSPDWDKIKISTQGLSL